MPQADTENTTASESCDLIVMVARQLNALQKRNRELDELPEAIGSEAIYRRAERDDLEDRIDILRDFISTQQAKSLAGAAIQVVMIDVVIDPTLAFEEKAETKDKLRYERLLHSVQDYLGSLLPDGLLALLTEVDGSAHCNPWVHYETHLANIATRRAA